jgi:3-oxoacyl-[acyl-carrier-protein] synthase-3
LGVSLPEQFVTSEEIDRRLGLPPGSIFAACGVASRPQAGPGETQEALGVAAARQALAEARLSTDDIDLLLFAAAVGRQPIPATAALIKRELGATEATFPAYDINATCLSALTALDIASMHIQTGRARHVLVVSAEIASSALPWADSPDVAGLFGDGAAAMVLSAAETGLPGPRLGAFRMETYAESYDACGLSAGGTRYPYHADPEAFARHALFRMDGRALYKMSSAVLPGFLSRLLDGAGWSAADVDLVVPHQASPHALAHIARRCGFSPDRVFNNVARTGNLVAASLPVALHMARAEGCIGPGARVLLIGTSAGVSLGGAVLQA